MNSSIQLYQRETQWYILFLLVEYGENFEFYFAGNLDGSSVTKNFIKSLGN